MMSLCLNNIFRSIMFYPEFCGFVGTQMQLAKHLDDVHGSLLCSSRSTHLKTLGYHCSMCGEWKRYKIAVHNHGCIKATPIPHNTLVSYGRGKGKGLTNSKKLLLKQDFTQLLFDNFILWMTNGAVEADLQAVLKTLCDLSASVPLLCGENAFQYIANGINASNSGKTNRRDARSFLKIWNKTMTNIATQNPPETLPHVASSSRGEFQSMEADEQTAKENGSTSEQSGTLEQQQIMLKISMQLAQLSETMHRLENKQRLVEVLAKKALAREMPKARNGRNGK